LLKTLMVICELENESIVEDLKKALLKHGYSLVLVERILRWYS